MCTHFVSVWITLRNTWFWWWFKGPTGVSEFTLKKTPKFPRVFEAWLNFRSFKHWFSHQLLQILFLLLKSECVCRDFCLEPICIGLATMNDMTHYKHQTEGLIELLSPPKQDLDVFWSSSLQHMTVSGGQVTLANCLVTCRAHCHLTVRDEWENTECCYSVWSEFSFFFFFRADSPLPYWARAGGHVVRPGMQQRAIQLRSNGMLWHHRPADCLPAVKALPIFGVVGMNWLWYRGRIFFLKKIKLP